MHSYDYSIKSHEKWRIVGEIAIDHSVNRESWLVTRKPKYSQGIAESDVRGCRGRKRNQISGNWLAVGAELRLSHDKRVPGARLWDPINRSLPWDYLLTRRNQISFSFLAKFVAQTAEDPPSRGLIAPPPWTPSQCTMSGGNIGAEFSIVYLMEADKSSASDSVRCTVALTLGDEGYLFAVLPRFVRSIWLLWRGE